jgi:serine/threonine-protein kinase
MSQRVGTKVGGKYTLHTLLGEGGLGQVYYATQAPMNRAVAVKLLHPEYSSDENLAARFAREAQAASQVTHPNAVVIHDFGRDTSGRLYLVMEYLAGETLHERIQRHPDRRLPPWEAVEILSQVLRPLGAFHQAGVVHRDLKPDNIMLCPLEVGEQVKLLDFGIAKVSGVSLTATGQMVGTPHYMSPEQICAKKDIGPEVDIYAMGVLLYEALTGDPPFLAEHTLDLFRMHLKETPKSLAEVLPEIRSLAPFDAVIRKAMAKSPQDRYRTARELREAMEAALVSSVAQEEEERLAGEELTPSWWEEATVLVAETVRMPRVTPAPAPFTPSWGESVADLPLGGRLGQRVSGFFRRVSRLIRRETPTRDPSEVH